MAKWRLLKWILLATVGVVHNLEAEHTIVVLPTYRSYNSKTL